MDYNLIMIRIEQHLKMYQKSMLDNNLDKAKTQAAIIVELAEHLQFVTEDMK